MGTVIMKICVQTGLALIFAGLLTSKIHFKWGGTDIPSWMKNTASRRILGRMVHDIEDGGEDGTETDITDVELQLVMDEIEKYIHHTIGQQGPNNAEADFHRAFYN